MKQGIEKSKKGVAKYIELRYYCYKLFNLSKTKISFAILITSLLLVLFLTLFPFNFSWQEGFDLREVYQYFYHPSNLGDFLINIFFFIPFGFSLTYLLIEKKIIWHQIAIIVILASFSLSLTVETLQIFLPSRSSSSTDIISNSFGGWLGCLGFYALKSSLFNNLKSFLSLKTLTICFISYFCVTFLLSIPLPHTTNFNNWHPDFPLVIGNESTGDRPWQGYISEVYIADRVISKIELVHFFSGKFSFSENQESLVAYYQPRGKDSYSVRAGNLPHLSWQGEKPKQQENSNAFFNSSHWLATSEAAISLTKRLRQTSKFTIITTVATADTNQTGPARIISLSGSRYQRNFTLAQEESHLIFRLRTPITGKNGVHPELILPDVFIDTKPHQLVITYADSLLQVYIDNPQKSYYLQLTPRTAIMSYFFPEAAYELKRFTHLLEYGLIFIPLGFLLAFINLLLKKTFVYQVLLIFVGLFLPTLILEVITTTENHRNINLENMMLSLGIMSITILVVAIVTKLLPSNNRALPK